MKGRGNAAWITGPSCTMTSQKIAAVERRKARVPVARHAGAFAKVPSVTCAVRRSASLFGEQRHLWEAKTWPPVRSRQAFLESVKEDPDASRIAAMQFRVVIAGLTMMTRGCVAV